MSSPQFTVTLDGSGRMAQDAYTEQRLSAKDRLGSSGARGKRARYDSDAEERRRSTGSVAGGAQKRARLESFDLRHRLSGPPEVTDLRQRLTSQDSGSFLKPAPSKPIIRPSSIGRQVRTSSDSKPGARVLQSRSRAVSTGGTDLRSQLNAVTPLPEAIPSSVPSSAPRRTAAIAHSTVTDVRSKPAVVRPVVVTQARPAVVAESAVRPVVAPQARAPGKLRSEVVLPGAASSIPSGMRKLPPAVKRANPETMASVVAVTPAPIAAVVPPKTVKGLLISLGLEKYLDIFVREEVDMAALRHMEESDLKELGIPMGPRKKIVQALR